VVVAPERRKRPHEGRDEGFVCPFCPGNEAMTPPEIMRVPERGAWKVRVFPNKYPIVEGHEVIVDSPDHDADLDTMDEEHLNLLMGVWRRRLEAHSSRPYVILFRNYGLGAGASISHPHTQLVPLDVVPEIPGRESERLREGACLLCGDYAHVVATAGGYAVGVPHVQTLPYETWIFPLSHERTFSGDPPFGRILSRLIGALKGEFGVREYNLVLHQAPRGYDYHWHLEVMPRLGKFAGFELGTGMRVLHYSREEFVERLRRALQLP